MLISPVSAATRNQVSEDIMRIRFALEGIHLRYDRQQNRFRASCASQQGAVKRRPITLERLAGVFGVMLGGILLGVGILCGERWGWKGKVDRRRPKEEKMELFWQKNSSEKKRMKELLLEMRTAADEDCVNLVESIGWLANEISASEVMR